MITPSDRVLDLGLVVDDEGTCKDEFFNPRPQGGLGGWVAAEDDYPTVVKTCSRQRKFPVSPEVFSQELDSCTFTNGAVPHAFLQLAPGPG